MSFPSRENVGEASVPVVGPSPKSNVKALEAAAAPLAVRDREQAPESRHGAEDVPHAVMQVGERPRIGRAPEPP